MMGAALSTYTAGVQQIVIAEPVHAADGDDALGRAVARRYAPFATILRIGEDRRAALAGSLPFVAGIDHFLPAIFGVVHPRWRTPWFALLMQAVFGMVFAFLGQAGTSVKGAYDVLVSMGVITYFIPFLYLFASMFKLQGEPAGRDVIRVPGGKPVALMVAIIGFCTTLLTIVLSLIPAADEPNKVLAVVKIVGLTALVLITGVVLYWLGKRRASRETATTM